MPIRIDRNVRPKKPKPRPFHGTNKIPFKLRLTPEEHHLFYSHARERGVPLTQFLCRSAKEQIAADEFVASYRKRVGG